MFQDRERYFKFRRAWAATFNDPEKKLSLTPTHFALYSILRGRDWTKGFTPVSNPNKLNNGWPVNRTLDEAKRYLKRLYEKPEIYRFQDILTFCFGDTITLEAARERIAEALHE